MSRAPPLTIDRLPLFAGDEDIGEAVLGPDRKKEFAGYAARCKGMPPISPFWGGRYVPAVKAFLDFDQGLAEQRPDRERGVEKPWTVGRLKRRG